MIIEFLFKQPFELILFILDGISDFLNIDVVLNEEFLAPVVEILGVILYLFPFQNMLPIFSTIWLILSFKIYMSVMRLVLELIPFV